MELFIKDNQIAGLNEIVLFHPDGSYTRNITRETALSEGWMPYVDKATQSLVEYAAPILKASTGLTDSEALSMRPFMGDWRDAVGNDLHAGQIVRYGDDIYRVRQEISPVLGTQPPGLATAALYELIDRIHEGTAADPIPYAPPMEIHEGMIYEQDGVKYLCFRPSETALTHNLGEIVGVYVDVYTE